MDVAIDFTRRRRRAARTCRCWRARGINVVLGTTGWAAHERELRDLVATSQIGVLAAVELLTRDEPVSAHRRGRRASLRPYQSYGAWIHELHHSAKKDAPSGTALQLKAGMERAGYTRPIDMSSTRAGSIPGTHTVGFDGPADTITLTHTVRDRAVFARGALEAARWLIGKRGWFTMRDMLSSGP